jgi:beta-lactamase class D
MLDNGRRRVGATGLAIRSEAPGRRPAVTGRWLAGWLQQTTACFCFACTVQAAERNERMAAAVGAHGVAVCDLRMASRCRVRW